MDGVWNTWIFCPQTVVAFIVIIISTCAVILAYVTRGVKRVSTHDKPQTSVSVCSTQTPDLFYSEGDCSKCPQKFEAVHVSRCTQATQNNGDLDLHQLYEKWKQEYEAEQLASDEKKTQPAVSVVQPEQSTPVVVDEEAQRQLKEMRVLLDRLYADKERLTLQIIRQEKTQQDLNTVLREYEETIQTLVAGKETNTSPPSDIISSLMRDKEQVADDLNSVEIAFADLHRRYEKLKSVVEAHKKNEETLKNCVTEAHEKLKEKDERYELLRRQAQEDIFNAEREIARCNKLANDDRAAITAALKKAELTNECLQQAIQRKTKENQELMSICDDLIAAKGGAESKAMI